MQLERQLAVAVAGQVFVTMVVWFRLYYVRLSELKERKIKPQRLRSRTDVSVRHVPGPRGAVKHTQTGPRGAFSLFLLLSILLPVVTPAPPPPRLWAQTTLKDCRASDNLMNLFEMPVLFYALCAVAIGTHVVTVNFVRAAWVYVALRAAHSAIHCTYNEVMHRFIVYAISCLWLFGMWGAAALRFNRDGRP